MKWMNDFLDSIKPSNKKNNSGMFGAIGSVASSLIGGLFGNHAQSEANKANAAENEKNRQFASQQADLSYQRQRTLIAEQREYDSAVNQRKRLEEAGFNPYNMMDGSNVGTTQNMSAPPAASAPSPIPMQAQRYEWLQNMALQAAQIDVLKSQSNKNNSDADKSRSEKTGQDYTNDILKSNASFQDAKNQGEIDTMYCNIRFLDASTDEKKSNISLNSAKVRLAEAETSAQRKLVEEIDKNMEKTNEEINLIKQQVDLAIKENGIKQIELNWADKRMAATVRQLQSVANLNNAQAKEIITLMTEKALNLTAQTEHLNWASDYLKKQGINLDYQNEVLKIEVERESMPSVRALKTTATFTNALLNALTFGIPETLGGFFRGISKK